MSYRIKDGAVSIVTSKRRSVIFAYQLRGFDINGLKALYIPSKAILPMNIPADYADAYCCDYIKKIRIKWIS